jgi:hypothetical protein
MPDITETLTPNTNQLNAEDLLAGSIVVQIVDAKLTGKSDQPVAVRLSGDYKPWLPCLTMRRLLVRVIGSADTAEWVGLTVELYRDDKVTWGGDAVGGIRLRAISCIDKPQTHSLAASDKSRKRWTVRPLKVATPALTIGQLLAGVGATMEQADAWAATKDKPPISTLDQDGRDKVAAFLAGPSGAAALRDIAGTDHSPRQAGED